MAAMRESTKTQFFIFWKWIIQKTLHMAMKWTCDEGSQMWSLKILNKNSFKTEISCNFHKIQVLNVENK